MLTFRRDIMKKPLVRIILFFGILFILIEVTSFIFIPNKANLFEFGYNKKTKYDLLSEPNNRCYIHRR